MAARGDKGRLAGEHSDNGIVRFMATYNHRYLSASACRWCMRPYWADAHRQSLLATRSVFHHANRLSTKLATISQRAAASPIFASRLCSSRYRLASRTTLSLSSCARYASQQTTGYTSALLTLVSWRISARNNGRLARAGDYLLNSGDATV